MRLVGRSEKGFGERRLLLHTVRRVRYALPSRIANDKMTMR